MIYKLKVSIISYMERHPLCLSVQILYPVIFLYPCSLSMSVAVLYCNRLVSISMTMDMEASKTMTFLIICILVYRSGNFHFICLISF